MDRPIKKFTSQSKLDDIGCDLDDIGCSMMLMIIVALIAVVTGIICSLL